MNCLRINAVMSAVIGLLAAGCGSDPYQLVEVRGKVTTCEGKPAAGVTVVFSPIDDPDATGRPKGQPGKGSEGIVQDDGTFTLLFGTTQIVGKTNAPNGAFVGPHRVTFRGPWLEKPVLPDGEKELLTESEIKEIEEAYAAVKVYPPIPCGTRMEPSEVTVSADGPNHFDFTIP